MAFSRSPAMACAVSPITGTLRVASSALTRRVASQPSMTGRLMSIRIMSGRSLRAGSTPCCPSMANTTWKPRRMRRRESMSRLISLSSTNKTFAICRPLLLFYLCVRADGRAYRPPPHRLVDGGDDIQPRRAALLDHLAGLSQQALPLGSRKLFCCNDDDRDFPPLRVRGERIEHLETVHFRHHQVEQNHGRRRMLAKPVQGLNAVVGLGDRQAHLFDGLADHLARAGIVFDHQHGTFAANEGMDQCRQLRALDRLGQHLDGAER